jgi:hypothetical protein
VALALSGCVGSPDRTPTPSPSESSSPVFASDEEALAAAEAAYLEYSELINLIASEDNLEPERIRSVATDDYAPTIEKLFNDLRQRGLTIQGGSTPHSFSLLEAAMVGGGAEVSFLVCSDVSASRVVDRDGVDVTPSERPPRSALQVTMISSSDDARRLLVDREDQWSGDYC